MPSRMFDSLTAYELEVLKSLPRHTLSRIVNYTIRPELRFEADLELKGRPYENQDDTRRSR